MDYFFHFALFLAEFGFLGPLLIFGIFCVDKKIFINTAIVCFLSAFINAYLKSIWQIPLDPSLGKVGWAFPSGHTQFNLVIWLSLIYQIRKVWIALVGASISISSYFGMIHFHYHNWDDIYGGIFFAALIFLAFVVWDYFCKNRQLVLLIFSFAISVFIMFTLPEQPHRHEWLYIYLGMDTGLLIYLVLEHRGSICIVSKVDRRHLFAFTVSLICMYAIKVIHTNALSLIYLKGFMLIALPLALASYVSKSAANYKLVGNRL
ncbi:MAG: hypothetical protein K0R73_1285 [Candidatus Midichloriaceae bacterium]|jgi:undecaprenyl-diphosphatase|nr:hypothetical protein [Candidatus Midichloriaceae bacterium]